MLERRKAMDKLWDEELKSKIFCALGPDEGDGPDENEVWECIQQDRKHQREELLKQSTILLKRKRMGK